MEGERNGCLERRPWTEAVPTSTSAARSGGGSALGTALEGYQHF